MEGKSNFKRFSLMMMMMMMMMLKFELMFFISKIRTTTFERIDLRDLQEHGLFHSTWLKKPLLWQEFLNASLIMIPNSVKKNFYKKTRVKNRNFHRASPSIKTYFIHSHKKRIVWKHGPS